MPDSSITDARLPCDVCGKPLSAHDKSTGIPICPGIYAPGYRDRFGQRVAELERQLAARTTPIADEGLTEFDTAVSTDARVAGIGGLRLAAESARTRFLLLAEMADLSGRPEGPGNAAILRKHAEQLEAAIEGTAPINSEGLVEKIARALCEEAGYDPEQLEPGDDPYQERDGMPSPCIDGYNRKDEPCHFVWRRYDLPARAAIEAINVS